MALNFSAFTQRIQNGFAFKKIDPISMTPIGGTQTTTPSIVKPKLNFSAFTKPIKKFFQPAKEGVRIRDMVREVGYIPDIPEIQTYTFETTETENSDPWG